MDASGNLVMACSASNDPTEATSELTNSDIKTKIIQNEFKISDKVGKSKVWEIFGTVEKNTGEEVENVVACRKCINVYKFSRNSTSNLVKHNCYLVSKYNDSALTQKIDVEIDTKKAGILILTLGRVESCRSIKIVEDSGLMKFSEFLIATGAKYGQHVDVSKLLPHPTTIARNVGKIYDVYFKKICEEIVSIKDVGFGLTSDIWTDDYLRTSYLSLTIHFVRNGQLITRFLGMKSMEGERCTGGNITMKVQKILNEFDCRLDNKAIIVTDRGSNMVAAFRTFNHINCINDLLHNILENSTKEVSEVAKLCKYSSKLVKFLKKSDINASLRTSLKSFSCTRWNTMYYMFSSIEKSWGEIMKILQEKDELNRIDKISLNCIRSVLQVLKPFEESSKKLEAEKDVTLHLVIVHIHHLKKSCMPNNEDADIAKKLKETLTNLIETIVLPNMSIYHKIALFLFPPANKLVIFDENEKRYIKSECRSLMKSYMNDISNEDNQPKASNSISAYNSQMFKDFFQSQQTCNLEEKISYELRIYEDTNVTFYDDFDMLQWWHLNKAQFPLLYKTSCKILAVPASSAASKRVFSNARHLISEKRSFNGSNAINVNQLMFLNYNVNETNIMKELEQEINF